MTPRAQAIAFRAWQVASRTGWDCTLAEVAEEVGCDHRTLGRIMAAKGWTNRFRVSLAASNRQSHARLGSVGPDSMAVLVRQFERQAIRDVQRYGSIGAGAS